MALIPTPMICCVQAHGWGRGVLSLAIALQNVIWGIAQPFVGFLADTWGSGRIVAIGKYFNSAWLRLTPPMRREVLRRKALSSIFPWLLFGAKYMCFYVGGLVFCLGLIGMAFAENELQLYLR